MTPSRWSPTSRTVLQITARDPVLSIKPATVAASRPTGIRTNTTPLLVSAAIIGFPRHQRPLFPFVKRRTGENAAKSLKRGADRNAMLAELEFTDRMFMISTSLLYDGK